MKFRNETELLNYTETIKGKTFKEIDSKKLLENNSMKRRKGLPGQIVETGFYQYPLNNKSEADFNELGIELKVTGFIRNKNNTLRAKERLVLSKINYHDIVNETYENSHLIDKNKKLLIIWYEYEKGKTLGEFQIKDYQLYDMSQDAEIFENDFNIIKEKVKEGLAHELSEGDTSYLGACTKAATSKDRTTQPYSEINAKPRAFALKNSYMTGILRENNTYETIKENLNKKPKTKSSQHKTQPPKNTNKTTPKDKTKQTITPKPKSENKTQPPKNTNKTTPKNKTKQTITPKRLHKSKIPQYTPYNNTKEKIKTIDSYIYNKMKKYIGESQIEIYEKITENKITGSIPKNISKMISDKIIGKDKDLPNINDIFKKTSFIIKNVPVDVDYNPLERMSFKTISLSDFEDEWEDSYWKTYFEETTLLVICYEGKKGSKNGERTLKGIKKISFNDKDLDSFKKTYIKVKEAIKERDFNLMPTPKSFDGQILEIAPKGRKGDDAYNNFFKKDKTKVAFMLTKDLLREKLQKS